MREPTQGGMLMTKIKQVGARVFERILKREGIEEFNGAQGRILFVLWQRDDIPITALARQSGLAKTTLTSMLDRMAQAQLVTRVSSPLDRRQIRIQLTEKTRALYAAYERVSAQTDAVFYKGFSQEEIHCFEQMLLRILSNLEEEEQRG